jgi:hypothetical protein
VFGKGKECLRKQACVWKECCLEKSMFACLCLHVWKRVYVCMLGKEYVCMFGVCMLGKERVWKKACLETSVFGSYDVFGKLPW